MLVIGEDSNVPTNHPSFRSPGQCYQMRFNVLLRHTTLAVEFCQEVDWWSGFI